MDPWDSAVAHLTRLEPVRLLGEGGMGAVYEVSEARGRRVALKVLKAGSARDVMRFKREFRAIASFHHPNLVRLFDLEQLPDGRVLLEGPSGIGKTTVAEAFQRTIRAADCAILTGRCYEREALPFRALDPCMDDLALQLRRAPEAERAPIAEDLRLVATVFAGFGVLTPEDAAPRCGVVDQASMPKPSSA